ncbi:hypothetical protein P9112_001937 [Eukaryota sp. TZLM1-RC]
MNPLEYFSSLHNTSKSTYDYSRKDSPARRQVSAPPVATKGVEEGYAYNVWYHRWSGGGFDTFKKQVEEIAPAQHRCDIKQDEGTTKADETPGRVPFCLYFARGCCSRGSSCAYKHRLPCPPDSDALEPARDIFGRTRFSTDRDDYRGVGNFNRECKTLQVSNFGMCPTIDSDLMEHFSQWGEVKGIQVDSERCIAFVEYRYRGNAEFAKEAMQGQALNHKEILLIRWSQRDDIFEKPKSKRRQEETTSETEPPPKKVNVEAAPKGKSLSTEQLYADFLSTLE